MSSSEKPTPSASPVAVPMSPVESAASPMPDSIDLDLDLDYDLDELDEYPEFPSEEQEPTSAEEEKLQKRQRKRKLKRRRKRLLKRERKQKRKLKRKRQRRMIKKIRNAHSESVSDEVMVRFDHVTKEYSLYENDRGRFLGAFNIKSRDFVGSVKANDDISFVIKRGEAVAFLGLNGAGKSTALKMISGVTHPTKGVVDVNGRVSAMLELSAGFDKKLTGRENIYLRGQIMGLDEEYLEEIVPDVIEFADLGVYIDQPMRSYSSGMRARLGFALAVSIEPEILVVDEALAVGDQRFKRRCIKRMRKIMMDEHVTVLFVTHSTTVAQQFCTRGIVLDHGRLIFDGPIRDAVSCYKESTSD